MNTPKVRQLATIAACTAVLACNPAGAVDFQLSGFATLGYAQSNREFGWQRFITDGGGWKRDSLVAAQVDASLAPEWSATAQVKLAPSLKDDSRWDPTLTWAFVGWRPNNEWLLRAGRLRVPLYLFSETQDVGNTFTTARLPNDMYWLTPTTDFTGLYVTRSWAKGEGDVSLDAYAGQADTTFREWLRDGAPPAFSAGANFVPVRVRASGLVLTWREPTLTLRAGLHGTRTSFKSGPGTTATYPRVELAPGIGYWQVDDSLPGPGLDHREAVRNLIGTLGIDWQHGSGLRITAEAARSRQFDTEFGADGISGYAAVSYSFGPVTPYVSVGRLLSSATQRGWVERLSASSVPLALPGAAQLNLAQQIAAQGVTCYDQSSQALGASIALGHGSVIKFEWMTTHIGVCSSMADAAPGQPIPRDTNVQVRSVVFATSF